MDLGLFCVLRIKSFILIYDALMNDINHNQFSKSAISMRLLATD